MIIDILSYLLRFILVILVQLLVINKIELSTFINPYFYIVFILTLPVSMKPWIVVVLSFFTGLVMDTFCSTPGLHMAATGFMGYVRNFYLRFACSKEDYDSNLSPTLSQKGPVWFLVYAFLLTLLHHFFLFILEIYSFSEFFRTFSRIAVSTFFTVLIIGLSQLLFFRSSRTR